MTFFFFFFSLQTKDSSTTDVIRDIRDSKVEETTDGIVVGGAAVSHGDCEHASVADDGVLVECKEVDQLLSFLLSSVHDQRDTK